MKNLLSILILVLFSINCSAQHISYYVDFPNIAHHEARITMEVTGVKTSALTCRMSRSSPGRYATHEFGKNVYDVAVDPAFKNVTLTKTEGDVYQLSGIHGSVKLSYTLYGNHADGTYAGIDAASIHLNMPATFMWTEGLDKAPIDIEFNIPDTSFSIATQLKPGKNKYSFSAPDLQYFMDSPTKIGTLHWREWMVNNNGKEFKMRIALEANASEVVIDSLSDAIKKITNQASKIFGEYPAYDYGVYTFIISINPYVVGDGMEHRNSTMITLPQTVNNFSDILDDVYAHEFFHCWNVERIRPKTIEPFNFRKSNMSNELWCAEGFTQYYGELLMRRSQLLPDTSFIDPASAFINRKHSPGGTLYTPIQASNMAVFTDAGVSIDKTNFPNIFNSYYYYGASIALALDLSLRSKFNSSLDAFMQQMWKRFGKTEKAYTVADMENTLAGISNISFAKEFFANYVYDSKIPDYKNLLSNAGLELVAAFPGKAWMGNFRASENNGLSIMSNTIRNTPLYNAGLDIYDVIISIDGAAIKKISELNTTLEAHKPGDKINVVYVHRGVEKTANILLAENPDLTIVTYEQSGKEPTQKMIEFRNSWLGAK